MKITRRSVWLSLDGKVTTLKEHLVNAGYRRGYETTIAKRCDCKPSEIPLEILQSYLGAGVEIVETPGNWRVLIGMKPKNVATIDRSKPVTKFLTMQLSPSPQGSTYY